LTPPDDRRPPGRIALSPPASIHLIGICGTGMGALAGLLRARGFAVNGSDASAYPPMSDELAAMGIRIAQGYAASNLDSGPDLVVVGNVCRADHPEAAAARERGLPTASMPRVVRDLLLEGRRSIVVAGTHGKTTTSAITAFLLDAVGLDPSFLIGGVVPDLGSGHRLGGGPDFVIEGDEYDSAYFEKIPKFLSYNPAAAVVTSVEHDHVDIYPTAEAYREAFRSLAALVSPGPLAIWAGDPTAADIAGAARVEVETYAVEGDPSDRPADWTARPTGDGSFELLVRGEPRGRSSTSLAGRHNMRNCLAAIAMAHRAAGAPLDDLLRALPLFSGVARRQQVLGRPRGISVYDDFAHHPTAVRETLEAIASRHPGARLVAVFEPRSATACRRLHQGAYPDAFGAADLAIVAPVARRDLPEPERLDTRRLARDLELRGVPAVAAEDLDEIVDRVVEWARPGDVVAILSNGSFGGVGRRLVEALG